MGSSRTRCCRYRPAIRDSLSSIQFVGPDSPNPKVKAIPEYYGNFGPAIGFAYGATVVRRREDDDSRRLSANVPARARQQQRRSQRHGYVHRPDPRLPTELQLRTSTMRCSSPLSTPRRKRPRAQRFRICRALFPFGRQSVPAASSRSEREPRTSRESTIRTTRDPTRRI